MTYQIGRLQLMKFISEARQRASERFRIRDFPDFVWKNGLKTLR